MFRVALLISGRAARYEVCLLPFLENIDETQYKIDLFMSINDEMCPYYENMIKRLQKWLIKVNISKYELPEDYNHTHYFKGSSRFIDGKWVHYNQMSMYFNDLNSFTQADIYSKENNIYYDYFMKFRADILSNSFPKLEKLNTDILLFSVIPLGNFISHGIFKRPIVSDAWVWGNKETMRIYCNTYNFVRNMLKELNGNYYIGFEDCVTDNVYHNNISIQYIKHEYDLDKNRRIFNQTWSEGGNQLDSGGNFIPVFHKNIDIRTITDILDIPAGTGQPDT